MMYLSNNKISCSMVSIPWYLNMDIHHGDPCHPLVKLEKMGIYLITKNYKFKRVIEKYAQYFRREFEYDFVQYSAIEENNYENTRPFIFCAHKNIAYGACCFRYRKYLNETPKWALQWIWFHPYSREKGKFKEAFPLFLEYLGNFWIEMPLSNTMNSFIQKHYRWQFDEIERMKKKNEIDKDWIIFRSVEGEE